MYARFSPRPDARACSNGSRGPSSHPGASAWIDGDRRAEHDLMGFPPRAKLQADRRSRFPTCHLIVVDEGLSSHCPRTASRAAALRASDMLRAGACRVGDGQIGAPRRRIWTSSALEAVSSLSATITCRVTSWGRRWRFRERSVSTTEFRRMVAMQTLTTSTQRSSVIASLLQGRASITSDIKSSWLDERLYGLGQGSLLAASTMRRGLSASRSTSVGRAISTGSSIKKPAPRSAIQVSVCVPAAAIAGVAK